MRDEDNLVKILAQLRGRISETPPEDLADRIKARIPGRLMIDGSGSQPISVFINLRINRLAAAAIIVASLVVFYGLFGRAQLEGGIVGTVRELFGWRQNEAASMMRLYQEQASKGIEVVFFEQNVNRQDPTLILMYWRLPEGDYRVIFSNGRVAVVSAETLIRLQASMIHRMAR